MKRWLFLLLLLAPLASAAQEVPAPLKSHVYPQARLSRNVGQGQFSGIAYLGDYLYAVVDDKLPGGGIIYMQIGLTDFGRVKKLTPEATAYGTITGRDNEGVAFVPSSQKLWVSSEADQRIREYGLDGVETGRELQVPAGFGTANITANMGFEGLTYNEATARFWTITEGPLKGETTHRLLCFTEDGAPGDQYLYQMEAPQEKGTGASAYVFGVPALTALDDGRVLVLEREVFVPGGSLLDKAFRSVTHMQIYEVNPRITAPGTLLEKHLVASWSTSAINLANYEGMCLGPKLTDGARCLVLIADSQGGSNGLTAEYIKIITIE